MTTLEMMNKAAKTNKIYISGDNLTYMRYSEKLGFHDDCGMSWFCKFKLVNDILDLDCWRLLPPKRMTIKDIEEKLGYEIELISE